MSLRNSLIATAAWLVFVIIVSIAMISYIASTPQAGSTQRRSETAGQGMGIVATIGLAAIWIPYASRIGAEKRSGGNTGRKKTGKKRKKPRDSAL